MKQVAAAMPANAFIKVLVGTHIRRVHFKDVKRYRKVVKPTLPPLPPYDLKEDWNKSAITSCEFGLEEENVLEERSCNI